MIISVIKLTHTKCSHRWMNKISHWKYTGQNNGAFRIEACLDIVLGCLDAKINIHAPSNGLVDDCKENEENSYSSEGWETIEETAVANTTQAKNDQEIKRDWFVHVKKVAKIKIIR